MHSLYDFNAGGDVALDESYPAGIKWRATAYEITPTAVNWHLEVYAICATVAAWISDVRERTWAPHLPRPHSFWGRDG